MPGDAPRYYDYTTIRLYVYSSRRPSSARLSVPSSAYSRSPPIGRPRASRVTFDGNPVKLTSQEYRLLAYLAHHRGKVVSRTELVEHLYDQDFDRDSNTIEVFLGRLRKKLDAGLIQTVRGLGYSLEDPKLGGTAAEV